MTLAERNMTLPSPPFVHIDGIHNFRDIGGYPCSISHDAETTNSEANGSIAPAGTSIRSTRRGLVYRCADPGRITSEGKEKMKSLGMATIFDLRSQEEIKGRGPEALENIESMGREKEGEQDNNEQNPDSVGNSNGNTTESGKADGAGGQGTQTHLTKRVWTPAFPLQDYGPEAIALRYAAYQSGTVEGFTSAYRDILKAAGPSYRTILLHLRDRPSDPFVVHCSAGKDRTGVIIALILKIAGVADDIVAEEYQLTEVGLGPMREAIVAHLLGSSDTLGGDRGKAEKMIGARKDYMTSSLKMLEEEFGGAEAYVKQYCGLTDEDVELIRDNITVEAAPIHYT